METWVWHEHFVDEVDDTVGGDDVLLEHHLDAVDSQTFTVTADLDAVALQSLVGAAGHDGLRALHGVQQVEVQKSWKNEAEFEMNVRIRWTVVLCLAHCWSVGLHGLFYDLSHVRLQLRM